MICFGKGLPRHGESNSHGNLPGAWLGTGEVVLIRQRVKAQNENTRNHELTWQVLLYKHQGTTGMPQMVLHIANVCHSPIRTKLGPARTYHERRVAELVVLWWPTCPGQLPHQAWQEVPRLPRPLLYIRSGKHSTIPHADQTDAWMLQWQELVHLIQSLVS